MKIAPFIIKKTGTILFCIGFFLIFTSGWGFYNVIRPAKFTTNTSPGAMGLEYENIEFETEDGLTIRGWYIPKQLPFQLEVDDNNNEEKTIIAMHGWPADKGNILPAVAFMAEEYNLLLFDFRHLGESDGSFSTVGARETKDLEAAIEYLKNNKGVDEVGLWGFSLGGAVALMTAPERDEVKTIYSDGSFAELDMLTGEIFRIPLLNRPLGELTSLWGRVFLGINTKDVSPASSAAQLDIPVLISHSENDEVISFEHALLLEKSLQDNENAHFIFKENVTHGQITPQLKEEIREFFKEHL